MVLFGYYISELLFYFWFKCLFCWILGMVGIIVGYLFDIIKVCVFIYFFFLILCVIYEMIGVMFNYDVIGLVLDVVL